MTARTPMRMPTPVPSKSSSVEKSPITGEVKSSGVRPGLR
jgi:hypothetical protein